MKTLVIVYLVATILALSGCGKQETTLTLDVPKCGIIVEIGPNALIVAGLDNPALSKFCKAGETWNGLYGLNPTSAKYTCGFWGINNHLTTFDNNELNIDTGAYNECN